MSKMVYHRHVVKKGENLHKIAKAYGIRPTDWRKIYDHPKNAKFKKLRKDPNTILPKDVIFVPAISASQLFDEREELLLRYKAHSDMDAPLALLTKSLQASKKALDDVGKAETATKSDITSAKGAMKTTKADFKRSQDYLSLCQRDTRADGINSAVAFMVCKRESDNMWKAQSKMLDAASKHEALLSKYEKDKDKTKKAVNAYVKELEKARKDIAKWKKDHTRMSEDLRKAIRDNEAMVADTF